MVTGRYSKVHVETDAEVLSDAAQVRAMHGGKVGFTIGTNALVALVVSVLTWYLSRHEPTPVNCASREDMVSLDKRIESLRSDVVMLTQKVSQDAERNHNDVELMKLRLDVISRQGH